jgi:hypothetical protein
LNTKTPGTARASKETRLRRGVEFKLLKAVNTDPFEEASIGPFTTVIVVDALAEAYAPLAELNVASMVWVPVLEGAV